MLLVWRVCLVTAHPILWLFLGLGNAAMGAGQTIRIVTAAIIGEFTLYAALLQTAKQIGVRRQLMSGKIELWFNHCCSPTYKSGSLGIYDARSRFLETGLSPTFCSQLRAAAKFDHFGN